MKEIKKPDSCNLKVKFSYGGNLFKKEEHIVDLFSRIESINEVEEVVKHLKKDMYATGMFTKDFLLLEVYNTKDFSPPLVKFKILRKDLKIGESWDMSALEEELLDNLTVEILEVSFKYKLKKS